MKRLVVGLILVVVLWAEGTSPAMATFTKAVAGSTSVSAHALSTPVLSCTGLGVLSVRFTWTAPADTSQPDVYGSGFLASGYELLRSSSPGGPYTVVYSGTATTSTQSVTSGNSYYVVRTTKHAWRGPVSNQRQAVGILFLAATCS